MGEKKERNERKGKKEKERKEIGKKEKQNMDTRSHVGRITIFCVEKESRGGDGGIGCREGAHPSL